MKVALLLIDLQNDFLHVPNLEPSAGEVAERASTLLHHCRAMSVPTAHIWTTIRPEVDNRMPHWKHANCWRCIDGTDGYRVPDVLSPISSELIVHKSFYSAFEDGNLDRILLALGVDTLFIAGIYLHGCIRATVLDAYQRGYNIWVAEDAVASDDPVHAAITNRYLNARAAKFAPVCHLLSFLDRAKKVTPQSTNPPLLLPSIVSEHAVDRTSTSETIIHVSPGKLSEQLWQVPICGRDLVEKTAIAGKRALREWQKSSIAARRQILFQLADLLEQEREAFVTQLAIEVGKPSSYGHAEVTRAIDLLQAIARREELPIPIKNLHATYRYVPVGVVAVITPWNNPLAIPIGKIAPALLYGNTVVWKPAIPGAAIAIKLMELLQKAGCPPGVVNLVCGDRTTAQMLMSNANIDAVSLSGSSQAGYFAQDICARRRIPLQAELGGNNAAIIWSDCDLDDAARQVVLGAFGFAGQRCTANRRVIVAAQCFDKFAHTLIKATSELIWGDPLQPETQVGPLVSPQQRDRVAAFVARAKAAAEVIYPLQTSGGNFSGIANEGAYYSPTVIHCGDHTDEIVQEETFGPVLVVQKATDWEDAMELCNSVRQGLVAALFSKSTQLQESFLDRARAGVLKLNCSTVDVAVDIPFGGWKASGVGAPEHGSGNREFYTRTQAIYKF